MRRKGSFGPSSGRLPGLRFAHFETRLDEPSNGHESRAIPRLKSRILQKLKRVRRPRPWRWALPRPVLVAGLGGYLTLVNGSDELDVRKSFEKVDSRRPLKWWRQGLLSSELR